jgi:hypothetical protein
VGVALSCHGNHQVGAWNCCAREFWTARGLSNEDKTGAR